jgi:hypothetical protein
MPVKRWWRLQHETVYFFRRVLRLGFVEVKVSFKNLAFIAGKTQGAVEIGLILGTLQQTFLLHPFDIRRQFAILDRKLTATT